MTIYQATFQTGCAIHYLNEQRTAQTAQILTDLLQYGPFCALMRNSIDPNSITTFGIEIIDETPVLCFYGKNLGEPIPLLLQEDLDPVISEVAAFLMGHSNEPPKFPSIAESQPIPAETESEADNEESDAYEMESPRSIQTPPRSPIVEPRRVSLEKQAAPERERVVAKKTLPPIPTLDDVPPPRVRSRYLFAQDGTRSSEEPLIKV